MMPVSPLLRAQSDRRLSELAAAGSEPAFEALVRRYERELQSHCRRLLLEDAHAEDAVQQAFLKAWQALRNGAEVRDARPWLHRIAHNTALDALRRGYDHAELHEALRGADGPEVDLERRTVVRTTLASLAALPEMQREALLRTAVAGRSYEEVAGDLGLTDGAVRGLVHRARTSLRAAATALTPAPLLGWAAGGVGTGGAAAAGAATSAATAGVGAGASAVVLKTGAAVLAAGALAGGGVAAVDAVEDRGNRPATVERSAAEEAGASPRRPAEPPRRSRGARANTERGAAGEPRARSGRRAARRRRAGDEPDQKGAKAGRRESGSRAERETGSGESAGAGKPAKEKERDPSPGGQQADRPAAPQRPVKPTKPPRAPRPAPSADEPAASSPATGTAPSTEPGTTTGRPDPPPRRVKPPKD